MTTEKAIEFGKIFLKTIADEKGSATYEFVEMAIKALEQEPCEDAISRDELLKAIDTWDKFGCDADTKLVPYQDHYIPYIHYDDIVKCIKGMSSVTPKPKTGHWNNHQIACMLADLFGDACACNYNGIDEWLSEVCDFKDTCCPNTVGVACWEQFLKYSQSRYTESEDKE